jgi:hypothetical protein
LHGIFVSDRYYLLQLVGNLSPMFEILLGVVCLLMLLKKRKSTNFFSTVLPPIKSTSSLLSSLDMQGNLS